MVEKVNCVCTRTFVSGAGTSNVKRDGGEGRVASFLFFYCVGPRVVRDVGGGYTLNVVCLSCSLNTVERGEKGRREGVHEEEMNSRVDG